MAILGKVELENDTTNDIVESLRRNVMNILEEEGNFQAQNLTPKDQLDKYKQVKQDEYVEDTKTSMDLKMQVE